MRSFIFLIVLIFSSIGTAFADFDAYIDFMDVTEDNKVNLFLTGIVGQPEANCSHNIVHLGHNPNDKASTTSSHLYSAALTAMTAGKKIRLHTIGCVTKNLRIYK